MPTMGRLVAGIVFGALAYYVSTLIIPLYEEGTVPKFFAIINTAIGILMGWIVAGSRAGDGLRAAVGYGLTTIVAISFWFLFSHSFVEMIKQSLRKKYHGPVEAVTDVFNLGIDLAQMAGTPEVLTALVVGGIIAGLITEFFGQRFP